MIAQVLDSAAQELLAVPHRQTSVRPPATAQANRADGHGGANVARCVKWHRARMLQQFRHRAEGAEKAVCTNALWPSSVFSGFCGRLRLRRFLSLCCP